MYKKRDFDNISSALRNLFLVTPLKKPTFLVRLLLLRIYFSEFIDESRDTEKYKTNLI